MKVKLCTALCAGMLCTVSSAKAEIICTEQQNGKPPICVDVGDGSNAPKSIVIKPGHGCGTSSACGVNHRVEPKEHIYEKKDLLDHSIKGIQKSLQRDIQR